MHADDGTLHTGVFETSNPQYPLRQQLVRSQLTAEHKFTVAASCLSNASVDGMETTRFTAFGCQLLAGFHGQFHFRTGGNQESLPADQRNLSGYTPFSISASCCAVRGCCVPDSDGEKIRGCRAVLRSIAYFRLPQIPLVTDAMCSCLVSRAGWRFAQPAGESGRLHPDR